MSDANGQPEFLPEVEVREQRWPSPVWLIPLTAILIGLWLLLQAWYQQGPTITVQFNSAEGIEAGKTEVRYKAVTVGKLRKLRLSDDLQTIEAVIDLNKEIGRHLGSDARFWVVSPRISRSGVSGLSTFFSGTYIGMDPGTNTDDLSFYVGEDRPPVIAPSENGRRFFLLSNSLGSMDVGAPVFYKQLQVGEVIDYQLMPDGSQVRLEVFIRDPYYEYVHSNSRFWNASGAEFTMTSAGAEFRMESLASFLIGGVAFETPSSLLAGDVSPEGASFPLYGRYADTQEKQFTQRLYYVMYFNGSVRGLTVGAPLEYEGIPVGQVENIDIRLDRDSLDVRVPVLVSIQPQHFDSAITLAEAEEAMRKLVEKGLRARLETASLLTMQKVITLSMEKDPKPAQIVKTQFYSEFPTTGAAFENLPLMAADVMASLEDTLDGVNRLVNGGKLDKALDQVNAVLAETEQAIKAAKEAMRTVDKDTLPGVSRDINQITVDLGKTSQKIQESMLQIDRLTARNSPTQQQLQEMLEELTAASRSVRSLTETLQRQPASLLRGKKGE
ncbi:MlaD family protein [Candidatus Thiothrix sp. Deng01]|uniref:MlaD family protein n=1 Tax=Candidatus Thiothrix phosphatis TaxID=3112415 RepID=A0ABU6CXZ2_9GAMM|nr:MlaD family protein [Candidatus Thiothrix sp. Deng01]MEB4591705.1 MlaD family protein [Candidatus Thiothrix sp. Deng01]